MRLGFSQNTRLITTRARAIWTPVGLALANDALIIGVIIEINHLITESRYPLFGTALDLLFQIWLLYVTPTVLGGLFWFALIRLRQRRFLRVWLEASAIGIMATLLFTTVYGTVGDRWYENNSSEMWWVPSMLGKFPIFTASLIVVTMLYGLLGTGFATLFARWSQLRPSQIFPTPARWQSYGTLLVALSSVFVLSMITSPIILRFLFTLSSPGSVIVFPFLITLWEIFLPTLVMAGIGSVSVWHDVHNTQKTIVAPGVLSFNDDTATFTYSSLTNED